MSTKKSTKSSRTSKKRQTARRQSTKYQSKGKKMCKPNRFACLVVIIILGVAALVAVAFITIYSTMQNKEIVASGTTDAAKFASEYTEVPKDNVFVYKNSDEIINIIKHGTGVVYIGFPSCPIRPYKAGLWSKDLLYL